MSLRECSSLTWMGWGNQGGFVEEVAFIPFNKPLIPSSVPGPVMGPGESGKYSIPREACVDPWMAEGIRGPRDAPNQTKHFSVPAAGYRNQNRGSSLGDGSSLASEGMGSPGSHVHLVRSRGLALCFQR